MNATAFQHASIAIGNLVDTKVLALIREIDKVERKIDAAHDKLNSFIMMKRSLAMTVNELEEMKVDVTELTAKISSLDASISGAATDFLKIKMQSEETIRQLLEQISDLNIAETLESPVDFSVSQLIQRGLSGETMKFDAQYFSFGKNTQGEVSAQIEKYVRESSDNLGPKADEIAKSASSQVNQQRANHSIAGTLIITVSCTHRNVGLLEPLVIDPDKAISAWNEMFGKSDRIDATNPKTISQGSAGGEAGENSMTLVSGASYGSSFIGMVHMLKSEATSVASMDSMVQQLQERLKLGGWLQNESGGFGVDPSMLEEVKKMLSTQGVSSHVSMIVTGAVPAIASSQLQMGVERLATPDVSKINQVIPQAPGRNTLQTSAELAKSGNQLLQVQNSTVQTLISGLGKIDHGANSVLNINSLMAAFENYLKCIKDANGSAGIPVNFFLKKITRSDLEKLWMDKYYPDTKAADKTSKPNGNVKKS